MIILCRLIFSLCGCNIALAGNYYRVGPDGQYLAHRDAELTTRRVTRSAEPANKFIRDKIKFPRDKLAFIGSEGTGNDWLSSHRIRQHHDYNITASHLSTVFAEFMVSSPRAKLPNRTRYYYWAEFDNQLYWNEPYACRIRVNSDILHSWRPAFNNSGAFAMEAHERPPSDTTITAYFLCDGSCCDADCCIISWSNFFYRIIYLWLICLAGFWGSAILYFVLWRLYASRYQRPSQLTIAQPSASSLNPGGHAWQQLWLRRKTTFSDAYACEKKKLLSQIENNEARYSDDDD